eukprot:2811551-Rhodomonas_salina.2
MGRRGMCTKRRKIGSAATQRNRDGDLRDGRRCSRMPDTSSRSGSADLEGLKHPAAPARVEGACWRKGVFAAALLFLALPACPDRRVLRRSDASAFAAAVCLEAACLGHTGCLTDQSPAEALPRSH